MLAGARDKVATASLLFATLRRMMRWAVNQGDLERSPMEGMDAPAKAPSRDRVLSDDELRLVWKASYELGYGLRPAPFPHTGFRIASPELLPSDVRLPHLKCSQRRLGGNDEEGEHGDAERIG